MAETYISLKSGTLLHEDYYNLNLLDSTNLQSWTQTLVAIPGFSMILLGGYIYDIFGRKFSMFLMLFLGGISFIGIPLLAPHKGGYSLSILLINFFTSPLSFSPIIQDYVAIESYGKAQAFSLMGITTGVLTSLAVLF